MNSIVHMVAGIDLVEGRVGNGVLSRVVFLRATIIIDIWYVIASLGVEIVDKILQDSSFCIMIDDVVDIVVLRSKIKILAKRLEQMRFVILLIILRASIIISLVEKTEFIVLRGSFNLDERTGV